MPAIAVAREKFTGQCPFLEIFHLFAPRFSGLNAGASVFQPHNTPSCPEPLFAHGSRHDEKGEEAFIPGHKKLKALIPLKDKGLKSKNFLI